MLKDVRKFGNLLSRCSDISMRTEVRSGALMNPTFRHQTRSTSSPLRRPLPLFLVLTLLHIEFDPNNLLILFHLFSSSGHCGRYYQLWPSSSPQNRSNLSRRDREGHTDNVANAKITRTDVYIYSREQVYLPSCRGLRCGRERGKSRCVTCSVQLYADDS